MRDEARDWWEVVGDALGAEVIEAMNWFDFVPGFKVEFVPTIEVQHLAREL